MTELLFLAWRHLTRAERICLLALLSTLAVWTLLPAIPQDQSYHAFADQRSWLGLPHAADVLSNLAFVVVGVVATLRLASRDRAGFSNATEAGLWCLSLGFFCTGIGSAWYHLHPTDATLVWDRLPMTLVFGGILATALAQRIGQNVGRAALAVLFELGLASVAWWHFTGDLSLYATLQFGGIAALIVLLLATSRGGDPFPWWWVIGWYALAKVAEFADRSIWDATGGLVAGHALKHLFAAAAGAAMLAPLRRRASSERK